MSGVVDLTVEAQFKALVEDWRNAEMRGDVDFMERTYTDDFLAIGPRGYMLNKEDWLARYRSGDLQTETLSLDDTRVRLYGDAAVVTGIEVSKGRYKSTPVQEQLRTSLVWVRQNADWRLASIQMSPINPVP